MPFLWNLGVVFIGIMFLTTSTDKVMHWRKHLGSMEDYKIIKGALIKWFLVLFVIGELFISFSLFLTGITFLNFMVFLLILFTYSLAILINLLRGNTNISCGCGSVLDHDHLSIGLIIRNLCLIAIYIFLYIEKNTTVALIQLSLEEILSYILLATGVLILYGIIREIRQNVVLTRKIKKMLS